MKAEDYVYSCIGSCYVHKETGELFEDDLKEYVQSQLEKEVIKAFKAGRKAGAIFQRQSDNEFLAEQYWIDLTETKDES